MPGLRTKGVDALTNSKRLLWLLLSCAGIIRILFVAPQLPNGLFDDAYITFRYADNLIRGFGFVFNVGERVQGTTSPLFALVLASLGRIFGSSHLEQLAVSVGIVAAIGTVYLCERILSATGVPQAVIWTFLTLISFLPSFIANSTSGMETPVVLFLMALSLYLYIQDRLFALSVVGVLLFLARVDTGLWLLALGIHILFSRRDSLRDLAWPLAVFCASMAIWLSFTKIYFGTVVPQSLVGKAVSHGAFVLPNWNYASTFLSAFVPAQRLGSWALVVIAAVFLFLIPPTLELWHKYPQLRPIVYFFPIYVVAFLASHAPLFSWYVIPPKWAFYFIAVYALWRFLSDRTRLSHSSLKPAYVMVLLGIFVFGLAVHAVKIQYELPEANPSLAISKYIEQKSRPDGRIFLEHIGLIGFRTDRYIYDYMGLVTPETTRLRRLYGSEWLPKAAREYGADVVILYDSDIPALQSQADPDAIWFQTNYVHMNDEQLPQSVISVFLKKDSMQLAPETWRRPQGRSQPSSRPDPSSSEESFFADFVAALVRPRMILRSGDGLLQKE